MADKLETWVDVNVAFGENAAAELVYGSDAVKLRLKNLLLCSQHSYPFMRSVGTKLNWFMFDSGSTGDIDELRESLYQSIRTFMPEIIVDRSRSGVVEDQEQNALIVRIYYTDVAMNTYDMYEAKVSKLN